MATERSGSLLAAGTSVVMAMLASACCWLPLLLVSLGVSAAGASSGFEKWRPLLLSSTAVLLGLGFYSSYFRRPKCSPGSACNPPNGKIQRVNRGVLWVATLLVLSFALLPSYAGSVLRALGPAAKVSAATEAVVLDVTGMTCEACSVHVERELLGVAGVLSASVSYTNAKASVQVDEDEPPTLHSLVAAVGRAGYTAQLSHKP